MILIILLWCIVETAIIIVLPEMLQLLYEKKCSWKKTVAERKNAYAFITPNASF